MLKIAFSSKHNCAQVQPHRAVSTTADSCMAVTVDSISNLIQCTLSRAAMQLGMCINFTLTVTHFSIHHFKCNKLRFLVLYQTYINKNVVAVEVLTGTWNHTLTPRCTAAMESLLSAQWRVKQITARCQVRSGLDIRASEQVKWETLPPVKVMNDRWRTEMCCWNT